MRRSDALSAEPHTSSRAGMTIPLRGAGAAESPRPSYATGRAPNPDGTASRVVSGRRNRRILVREFSLCMSSTRFEVVGSRQRKSNSATSSIPCARCPVRWVSLAISECGDQGRFKREISMDCEITWSRFIAIGSITGDQEGLSLQLLLDIRV